MTEGYTLEDAENRLEEHFKKDYNFDHYPELPGDVRLPLLCTPKKKGAGQVDMLIDIITESSVSKALYFQAVRGRYADIGETCAPRFYQYYRPEAKVFWAYGYYMQYDEGYDSFRSACEAVGIGLLVIFDKKVEIALDAVPLREQITRQVQSVLEESEKASASTVKITENLSKLLDQKQNDYVDYLVYYAAPIFQRREITGRQKQDLSLQIMDELQELEHVAYAEQLKKLGNGYRTMVKGDYDIALETIKSLWDDVLGTNYPPSQEIFEPVLQHLNHRYRDHFLHEFQVFLMGTIIIDKLYDTEPIRRFLESTQTAIELAWLATSTYHDFNYPIEESKQWMSDFLQQNLHIDSPNDFFILNLENAVVTDEFLRKIRLICGIIEHDVDDVVMRFILGRAALERNHAVLGALTFLKKVQDNRVLNEQATGHAALSIFLHDPKNWRCFCGRDIDASTHEWEKSFASRKLLPKLKFVDYPLEFLLAFVDEVQEWGRVGRGYEESEPRLEDIHLEEGQIYVHISMKNDDSYNEKGRKIQELKKYLQDERFIIKIESREGGSEEIFKMTGT